MGSGVSLSVMGGAPNVNIAVVSGLFVGSTQAMFMSMTLALIQASVDNEFRGRATSFYQMITLTPMAALGWGMGGLADVAQPRPIMVVSGIVFLVVMVGYASLSPWLRRLSRPAGWQHSAKPIQSAEVLPLITP